MADRSKIEWTDATWNPITGCSVVSPGCTNCYAMKLAGGRMRHHPSRAGLTEPSKAGPVWNGQVRFNEQWLDQPLRWERPRTIFVCAHGDLFHESVPDEWIDRVFAVMALAPHHRFQVLTKRADRMREYLAQVATERDMQRWASAACRAMQNIDNGWVDERLESVDWPLPNVWLGVSAEDQKRADERLPFLCDTLAAVRFVSAEPLLGPINLDRYIPPVAKRGPLDWVIVGGESGAAARPMHPQWARDLRDQCRAAGVAFHFKQWGEYISCQLDRRRTGPPHWGMPEALWQDGHEGFRFDRHKRPSMKFIGWTPDGQPWPAGTEEEQEEYIARFGAPECVSLCIGKKAAGRKLDGRTWDEMPA